METYKFTYNKIPIQKITFTEMVPEEWEEEIKQHGYYSYGYFKVESNEIQNRTFTMD